MKIKLLIPTRKNESGETITFKTGLFSSLANLTRFLILLAMFGLSSVVHSEAQQLPSPVRLSITPKGKEALQLKKAELTAEEIELYRIYDKDYLKHLQSDNPQKYEHITGFFKDYDNLSPEVKAAADKKLLYELYFENNAAYRKKLQEYVNAGSKVKLNSPSN